MVTFDSSRFQSGSLLEGSDEHSQQTAANLHPRHGLRKMTSVWLLVFDVCRVRKRIPSSSSFVAVLLDMAKILDRF